MGRHEEALEIFSRLLELRNDVGLLSEEYDPHLRRQTGNFPQAFSHISLINSAYNLSMAHGPAKDSASGGESHPK
jgi:GH15 family glucan-1,4-alpha-glucosidase